MEGVPDPGNLQLPPSLPGGTRGQHRLTQPTAGTGLQPAWPWDQRSMEVAESHLRAPPPGLALQQPLPSLLNQTHPLQIKVLRSLCLAWAVGVQGVLPELTTG